MTVVFFFNDTATTEIYTLSLHDALPIFRSALGAACGARCSATSRHATNDLKLSVASDRGASSTCEVPGRRVAVDRKSTRLNSSHANISYAVFCLKKKKKVVSTTYLLRDT